MNTPATLLLMTLLAAQPTTVVVPLDALAPPTPPPEEPPIVVLVDALDVVVQPAETTRVDLTWTFRVLEPTWVDLAVVGADLTVERAALDGRDVALPPEGDGRRHLVARLQGWHVLQVTGVVSTQRSRLDLPALGAARTTVQAAAPGLEVQVAEAVETAPHRFDLFGHDRLEVTWKPAVEAAPRPRVITSEAATAIRIDDGGVEGRASLRYRIRHGTADELGLHLPATAADLQIEGAGVVGFDRGHDRVAVRLGRAVRGQVVLDVTWRQAGPAGDSDEAAALPVPDGATTGWLSLLTADGALVLPTPVADLDPVTSRSLPAWSKGLIDGTAHTSYRVAGRAPRLDFRVLRFAPVDEPPTLIDEARYEVAYTGHGRVLMRARYQVRNDRNQYLHVVPPPGFDPMGVRVAGDVVQPVSDGEGGLFVPLEKSVETLTGLVTFPVELTLWGKEPTWQRRGSRQLVTPSVDAPVAYARWEVVLPPDVLARETRGVPTVVEQWTSRAGGLSYGRATGDSLDDDDGVVRGGFRRQRLDHAQVTGHEEDEEEVWLEDLSQETWNAAYRAYQDNRFEEADDLLEQSLEYNPDNAAAVALQGNVDLLLGHGQDDTGGEQVLSRRVREMAQARTTSLEVEQDKKKRKAEQAMRSGDIDAAVSEYRSLVELTEQLAVVEREEAVDQKEAAEEFSRQLGELERMSGERARRDEGRRDRWADSLSMSAAPSGAAIATSDTTEYLFDDVNVDGELLLPTDRGEDASRDLDRFEDEDGAPDMDMLSGLNGAYAIEIPMDPAEPPDVSDHPEPEMIVVTTMEVQASARPRLPRLPAPRLPAPPAKRGGRAGGGDAARDAPPAPTTPAATAPPPVGITAALQTVRVPRAGQVLRLEQRLVAENTPLTIEVGYRTPERRNR